MRRSLLSVMLVIAACYPAAAAETPSTIVVPPGTLVKMYVAGSVSPDKPQAGDTFAAQAASDVVVDDVIVVRKGSEGQGTIVNAKAATGGGAKALVLVMDWVYAVDGAKLTLSASRQAPDAKTQPQQAQGGAKLASFGIAGYFGVVSTYVSKVANVRALSGAPAP